MWTKQNDIAITKAILPKRAMTLVTVSCFILSLLSATVTEAQSSPIAKNLTIVLASQIPRRGVISSQQPEEKVFRVLNGQTVNFSRSAGVDYELQAGGLYWTQVQQVPADNETLFITPELQRNGDIKVSVSASSKQDSDHQQIGSTLLAKPGEWIQVVGTDIGNQSGGRTYSSHRKTGDALFIKVLVD